MLVVVTVLFSDFISLRERGTCQAYLNLVGAVGSTSGGPIGLILTQIYPLRPYANIQIKGGLFVQTIGWRW